MVKSIDPTTNITMTWGNLCDLFFCYGKPEFDKEFANDEHTDETLKSAVMADAKEFLNTAALGADDDDAEILAENFLRRL